MAIVLFYDWDQQLAGNISPHHQDIHIIEFPRVDKFSVGTFGAMQVGSKIQSGCLLMFLLRKQWHVHLHDKKVTNLTKYIQSFT
jgi:hypothetical protein